MFSSITAFSERLGESEKKLLYMSQQDGTKLLNKVVQTLPLRLLYMLTTIKPVFSQSYYCMYIAIHYSTTDWLATDVGSMLRNFAAL